ncbi:MAG: hypothetical protein K2X98_01300 [Alphaproteobacteria bacterium]|nr:hypothetical protein [Alphaproteobacteria bacterium]
MFSHLIPPPLACLVIVSFMLGVSFAGNPEILNITIAPFLLILSASFITLGQIHTYERDAASGVLLFLVGNSAHLLSYIMGKLGRDALRLIIPLTLCATLLLGCIQPLISISMLILFAMIHTITCLSTLALTHLLSCFSIRSDQNSLLSLFIIWPLLVPTLILSLTTLQESDTLASSMDTICLNFGLLMLTFGGVLLIIPHLLTSAFDE